MEKSSIVIELTTADGKQLITIADGDLILLKYDGMQIATIRLIE